MEKLTTIALQLLMYWLLVQPSSQASLPSAEATSSQQLAKNNSGINICALPLGQAPMFCQCKTKKLEEATKEIVCVVMNPPKVDDSFWEDIANSSPRLEKIELAPVSQANITDVPSKAFRLFKNLTHVTLEGATLEVLVEKAFSDIPSLIEINVARCSIVNLNRHAFDNMSKLNAINLNDNRIREINRDVFVNLPSLKTLVINRNNLTTIHDRALQNLTSLETIDLSENEISVITSDIFSGLKSLKYLNLRDNVIEMIGDRTFNQVTELQELYLDQNKITFMADGALEGLRNLRKLGLSHNKLVTLGSNIFSDTSSLNFLDLRSNALKTLAFGHVKGMLQELHNGTSHLYVDDNNFICDCNLAWMSGARNDTKNQALKDYFGSLTCFQEVQNTSIDKYEVGNNETGIEVKHGSGESYEISKVKEPSQNEAEEEYNHDNNANAASKNETGKLQEVDGKLGYITRISEAKWNVILCPSPSEQSSPQGNALTNSGSTSKTKLFLSSCASLAMTILTLAVL